MEEERKRPRRCVSLRDSARLQSAGRVPLMYGLGVFK